MELSVVRHYGGTLLCQVIMRFLLMRKSCQRLLCQISDFHLVKTAL